MNGSDPLASALDPAATTYFTELLAPPNGMSFEQAIGTTFTLDLETALIPPLMVMGLTKSKEDARSHGPNLAFNLRHAVDRMTVFMEAGHLSNRRADDEIHVLLAPMLREVLVPRTKNGHRSFHPKVWVVHFTPFDSKSDGVIRVIISSRNLTRSISRDAMVMLEGRVSPKKIALNAPLADFLRSLPALVVSQGAEGASAIKTTEDIERLAALLERTRLKAPEGFKLEKFTYSGPGRKTNWEPKNCDRLSIISPFCDEDTLKKYQDQSQAKQLLLVSRHATIKALPADFFARNNRPWNAYVFDEAAHPDDTTLTEDTEEEPASLAERSEQLHAKIFIEERLGYSTRTTIGSGNATSPAREGRNIEVYATLTSPAVDVPVVPSFDDFGNPSRTTGFSSLLRRYEPLESTEAEAQNEDEEFDPTMRFVIYELLNRHFQLDFHLDVPTRRWICTISCMSSPNWSLFGGIHVQVKPTPSADEEFTSVYGWEKGMSHDFSPTAVVDLSPFVTFRLSRKNGAAESFTTQLIHSGFPQDIHLAAVMRRKMPAASDWLDALAASLGMPSFRVKRGIGPYMKGSGIWGPGLSLSTPLLEALVSSLEDPQALMAFDRTLDAFGQALAAEPEDDVEEENLAHQKLLYRELVAFWKPFSEFLPNTATDQAGKA